MKMQIRQMTQLAELLEPRRLFSTYTVNAAGGANYTDLETAIVDSPAGSTLLVSPGTYTAHPTSIDVASVFWINKALTIKSIGGPASTILVVPTGQAQNLLISSSNVSIEGFSLHSGEFCVQVQDFLNNTTLTNESLKNLNLTPDASDGNGHGILYEQVTHSIIDDCTVGLSYANGIMLDNNSFYDTVENCTVNGTVTQHAIAIKNSNFNQILNDTVNSSGFDGIILVNADNNRITNNYLTDFQVDGISLGSTSDFNYIALNTVASTGYAQGRPAGTGIWMNDSSDSNTIFANTVSGSAECGIDVFVSSNNLISGNDVLDNYEGGIFVYDALGYPASTGPTPDNTVITDNYIHNNKTNAGVVLAGATNTDIERNYISGAFTGVYGSSTDVGISSERTANTQFINNTVVNVQAGIYVYATSSNLSIYRNRFINTGNNYIFTGATVQLDDSVTIGGNYWSDQPTAAPYTKFIYDQTAALGGGFVDNYPYPSEALGQPYAVTVDSPAPGTVISPFSTRAIQWTSTGSALVDIFYSSPETGDELIATNQPDTGVYVWNVPTLPSYSDYRIKIAPENSAGTMFGTPSVGNAFSIAGSSTLKLLSPGADLTTQPGASMTVAWTSTTPGTPVDVQLQTSNGTWTTYASAVTDDSATITVPNFITNTARIRIVNHGTSIGDTQDGYFRISNFGGVYAESNQLIGSYQSINWLSPAGTDTVDVQYWNGLVWTSIASELPDLGHLTWFVPEMATNGASIRVMFHNSSDVITTTAYSNPFNIQYTLATGALVPVYRAYNPKTQAQLYTSQLAEYNALPGEGWEQLGARYEVYDAPVTIDGISAVPNYRLYNPSTQQQYWTTDRTSYFGLRASGVWKPIGVVNYEFNTQVTSSIPLYRIAIGGPPLLEVWTTATIEYGALENAGWSPEGVDAYVFSV
jgi:parallel beta-helix repeat protein